MPPRGTAPRRPTVFFRSVRRSVEAGDGVGRQDEARAKSKEHCPSAPDRVGRRRECRYKLAKVTRRSQSSAPR